VVHDARGLDLVHGEDHRRRGAILAERLAQHRDLRHVEPHAAVFARHVGGEQLLVAEGGERLAREARLAVHGVGVGGDLAAADRVHPGEERVEVGRREGLGPAGEERAHRVTP